MCKIFLIILLSVISYAKNVDLLSRDVNVKFGQPDSNIGNINRMLRRSGFPLRKYELKSLRISVRGRGNIKLNENGVLSVRKKVRRRKQNRLRLNTRSQARGTKYRLKFGPRARMKITSIVALVKRRNVRPRPQLQCKLPWGAKIAVGKFFTGKCIETEIMCGNASRCHDNDLSLRCLPGGVLAPYHCNGKAVSGCDADIECNEGDAGP